MLTYLPKKYGIDTGALRPSCFLCVMIGCCGSKRCGSVQQQQGVMGRNVNVYMHKGDDNGKASVYNLQR
eukprot:scaffold133756_cov56-Cyclotella_meneghiniana.AAC.2